MKKLLFFLLLFPSLVFGQSVYTYGGKVLTYSGDVLTVTSGTPAVLEDGSTVAWYIADNLTTITKDGADLVSRWNDYLGSGHDLIQATGTNQPLWSSDGILFDGVDNFMKTAAFTYVQPEMIYMVFKQVTWTLYDRIFDGNIVSTGQLAQRETTPNLLYFAGGGGGDCEDPGNLAVNTWGIIRMLFNGASTKFIINETTPITCFPGLSNMGGFTLGARGDDVSWSNIEVKEIILRNVDDTDANETDIYNYLKNKYGL